MKLICLSWTVFFWFSLAGNLRGGEPFSLTRCEVIPQPEQQASFQIDGVEKVRWHFGSQYPRPFFYPLCGPSGATLTRMGHPGAENHDHHRSVWFAHNSVGGGDFWSDRTEARVRQKFWYCYQDSDAEAVMATASGWYGGDGKELMQQDLVAALMPLAGGEHALELQIAFRPPAQAASVELGKTNFGFLAVRVAKTIAVYFGGGKLTNSEGLEGEAAVFGKPARWMDYSGPVPNGHGPDRQAVTEGITYFDHPQNPRYPTPWHVREDGWMGAAFCLNEGFIIAQDAPLVLRYLLHAHRGPYDPAKAQSVADAFAKRPGFEITKSTEKHLQYETTRKKG